MGIESIPVVVKCQHCGSTIADNMAKMDHAEDKRTCVICWSKLLSMRYLLRYGHRDPYWESGLRNV